VAIRASESLIIGGGAITVSNIGILLVNRVMNHAYASQEIQNAVEQQDLYYATGEAALALIGICIKSSVRD
jgi:hypothetical protein